jgi:hypothetical protein
MIAEVKAFSFQEPERRHSCRLGGFAVAMRANWNEREDENEDDDEDGK